jgi:hypothetical protein
VLTFLSEQTKNERTVEKPDEEVEDMTEEVAEPEEFALMNPEKK